MSAYKLEVGSEAWIEEVCTYHPADDEQMKAYSAINEATKEYLRVLFKHVPACADRSAAVRLARELRMMANAGVALKGLI